MKLVTKLFEDKADFDIVIGENNCEYEELVRSRSIYVVLTYVFSAAFVAYGIGYGIWKFDPFSWFNEKSGYTLVLMFGVLLFLNARESSRELKAFRKYKNRPN
jgi:hypothetical protein